MKTSALSVAAHTPGLDLTPPPETQRGVPPSGIRVVSPGKHPHNNRDWLRAAHTGHRYLEGSVSDQGPQSVIGLDPAFSRTIAPQDLRRWVLEASGKDIGFDGGPEGFSSMIGARLLGRDIAAFPFVEACLRVVSAHEDRGRYRFFTGDNGFADDTDCTGVAVAAREAAGLLTMEGLMISGGELLVSAAPETLSETDNLDADTGKSNGALLQGVMMVYWDRNNTPSAKARGRKQDAAAAANALYALKLAVNAGLKDSNGVVEATTAYVLDHLTSGNYLRGTRYYPSPDTFLYYASYLHRRFPDLREKFDAPMKRALEDRAFAPYTSGQADDPYNPINIAMRVIASSQLGVTNEQTRSDVDQLIKLQSSDGSWCAAPFYSLGKHQLFFGSSAVTTMFAVKAIEIYGSSQWSW